MTESQQLLTEFASNGSEAAFREIVSRYLDLVYSTAVRLVSGDAHLAQDVAQTVFVDLAQKAKSLSREVKLGGWLHRHTCFVAANLMRGERRRQLREKESVEMNAISNQSEVSLTELLPLLDEAINQLGATDRAAVLCRFYERMDFRAVGEAMGINEAAAQKRVGRALEKLQTTLKRRGVSLSAAALGTALASEVVTAAPVGMVVTISSAALSAAAAGTSGTLTVISFMASTKLKTGLAALIVAASIGTPLWLEHQAQATLHAQATRFRQQADQMAQLKADIQRLSGQATQTRKTQLLPDDQFHELLKLRGEVGVLTRSVQELTARAKGEPTGPDEQLASMKAMYAVQVDRLKQWLEANPAEKIPELATVNEDTWLTAVANLAQNNNFARSAANLRANAEHRVLSRLWMALQRYGKANGGQFPSDLAQLTPFLDAPIEDAILQRYQIVSASKLIPELQAGGDWLLTQKAPVNAETDMRTTFSMTESRDADERITNRWTLKP